MSTRTTLTLDDDLLRIAKEKAARSGRTVSQVFEDAARVYFADRPASRREPVTLVTSPGGPRPGVDLDSNAALLEFMEEE